MTQAITLYLIGFAGVGKYTISKEITKFGYKVVDNQLINNPIFSLLNLDGITPISNTAWDSIDAIRKAVMGFVSQDTKQNYVFTNELCDVKEDRLIFSQVKEAAEKRMSLFIPVKLSISFEEHKKRISNSGRLDRFKTTKLHKARNSKELIKIDDPHLLQLDVTNLSPSKAAGEILSFIEQLGIPSKKRKPYPAHEIILDETDNSEIRETLWQKIKTFNQPYFGKRTDQAFSLTIRDENSTIIAGVNGVIFLDQARVEFTWVDEKYRGLGLGRKLFQRLEAYCRDKKCRVIQLYTFDFQAPSFYEKMGFETIGTVSEWTCGHDCYFMRKML